LSRLICREGGWFLNVCNGMPCEILGGVSLVLDNPNGIAAFQTGLRGTSYPG